MNRRIEDVLGRDRLEMYEDSRRIGYLQYQLARDVLIIEHTVVEPDRRGHGYAGELVRHALGQARSEERRVIVVCPYAEAWLRQHPDQADLDYRHPRGNHSGDARSVTTRSTEQP